MSCRCATWGVLDRPTRDVLLAQLMEWAWLFYRVRIKMLVRGSNVAVCELRTIKPGEGRTRKVMTELCLWADCGRVTLELTPADDWGADVARLTRFYESLGFQANQETRAAYQIKEEMIRYPVKGRGHERNSQ